MTFTPTYDWPLRFKQTRSWVIILVVLGCYLLLKKENVLTALVKALGKSDPEEIRAGSKACGVLCFCLAVNQILWLLADYYRKKWLKFVLPVLYVIFVVWVVIRDRHRPK